MLKAARSCTSTTLLCHLGSVSASFFDFMMDLGYLLGTGGTADLCNARSNISRQLQCRGCDEIEELLAWLRKQKAQKPGYEGMVETGTIHHSFAELDSCASTSRCVACLLLRRAFFLEQITVQGVKDLCESSYKTCIFARLHCTKNKIFLEAVLDLGNAKEKSAWILCSDVDVDDVPRLDLDMPPLHFNDIIRNLRPMVEECYAHHSACNNLRYSSANPSWLVQIMSNDMARLVSLSGEEKNVPYVALSYSWGVPETPEEGTVLSWTRSLAAGPNSPSQLEPFERKLLPGTLQDALRITESFGVRYIWIDCLCIPENSDWDHEAAKMHEVFGNAYFTLAATGAERAWDTLETQRQAWDYTPRGCNLDNYWLSTIDVGLNDMRMHAPLSDRGWVLQEERLSPRILYWCAQRAYWSCSECPYFIEGSQGFCNNRAAYTWSHPQRFLELCFQGDAKNHLQVEWFDIVASYVRRHLFCPKDRFLAITGLATRYLDARPTIFGTDQREEYMAGIWRGSIAHGLSWSLRDSAARRTLEIDDAAVKAGFAPPSWSWASLPFSTEIEFCSDFRQNTRFRLLTPPRQDAAHDNMDAVNAGASVRELKVEGRCRPFAKFGSNKVAWNRVCVKKGHKDDFELRRPEQFVHSRDPETGRIVSHEARKDFVVGRLDYAPSVEGGVPEGHECHILCLEIGESSMLLLMQEPSSLDGDTLCCRRVGAANGYPGHFFSGVETKTRTIVLV